MKTILILSTADWDVPNKTNKQHMAFHFEKLGFKVLYVESVGLRRPNLNSGRDLKRILRRLIKAFIPSGRVSDNIWVCSPISIPFFSESNFISKFNQILLSFQVSRSLSKLRIKNFILWSYHPQTSFVQNLDGMIESVYHCVDNLTAIPGINRKKFLHDEKIFLSWVNTVFVTSRNLKTQVEKNHSQVHYFPNVVDFNHFQTGLVSRVPDDIKNLTGPMIGFHGALSEYKIDFDLFFEVASMRPSWNFIIIGQEIEGQKNSTIRKLDNLSNVVFLGHKDYQILPSYIANFDVGLLPFINNDYTHSMFPMKFYEYIAAQVPVVVSPIDFVDELKNGFYIANSSNEMIEKIETALENGRLSKNEATNIVGQNTWEARLLKMLSIMGIKY